MADEVATTDVELVTKEAETPTADLEGGEPALDLEASEAVVEKERCVAPAADRLAHDIVARAVTHRIYALPSFAPRTHTALTSDRIGSTKRCSPSSPSRSFASSLRL